MRYRISGHSDREENVRFQGKLLTFKYKFYFGYLLLHFLYNLSVKAV